MAAFFVGFDLDMTLLDTRAGVAATWEAVAAETGVPVDGRLAAARLGPPLAQEAAAWFPPERVPAVINLYRSFYPDLAITRSTALPGAAEALDAVRRHGGRVIVVTAKFGRSARLHLDHAGLEVDGVVGEVFAEQKGVVLRRHAAVGYVGDHVGDVRAAAVANAVSVAVATGPVSADVLRRAGADVVLPDLTAFPRWFDEHVPALAGRPRP